MARIEGVELPRSKRVEIGMTYIFGVGLSTSHKILAATGINPDTRVKDLTEALDIKLHLTPQVTLHLQPVAGDVFAQLSLLPR